MRRLRWWFALPAAAVGGFGLDAASPSIEWWPGALIGTLLILLSLWEQRPVAGLIYGFVAGGAFWLPHIHWLTLYLGPIPWLALSAVMIAWFGLFGLAVALTTRGILQLRWPPAVLLLAQAVSVSGLWVVKEQLQSTWPYGGFAWGRLAHSQADGPLVSLVSWLGFAGLSGVLALACALIVAAVFMFVPRRPKVPVLTACGTALALASFAFVPVAALPAAGSVSIAAVQGNSKSGIFDDRENGDVFRDHARATEVMLTELESSGTEIDLIVWPENSGEFQLPEQPNRLLEVQKLAARAEAPVVAGTILQDPDQTFTNSSVVIDEFGDTGLRYDKRRPVPFAEYMPNRAFFRSLVPELVDLVQLDYAFGMRPSAFDVPTRAGSVPVGLAICFDIIFDDHAVAMIGDGAEVILAQTNNADFGRTDESAQQLQIARLRAVETGRAVVNISTVGTSAAVLPTGEIVSSLTPFTADAMVVDVPRFTGHTPALAFGGVIAAAFMILGATGLSVGVVGLVQAKRKRSVDLAKADI